MWTPQISLYGLFVFRFTLDRCHPRMLGSLTSIYNLHAFICTTLTWVKYRMIQKLLLQMDFLNLKNFKLYNFKLQSQDTWTFTKWTNQSYHSYVHEFFLNLIGFVPAELITKGQVISLWCLVLTSFPTTSPRDRISNFNTSATSTLPVCETVMVDPAP